MSFAEWKKELPESYKQERRDHDAGRCSGYCLICEYEDPRQHPDAVRSEQEAEAKKAYQAHGGEK